MSLRTKIPSRVARIMAAVVPFVTVMAATSAAAAGPCHQAMCSDRRLKRDIRPI